MAYLDQKTAQKVQELLAPIGYDVEMVVFTTALQLPGRETGHQAETVELLREVAQLNPQLRLIQESLGSEKAQALGIDRAPTTLLREGGSARDNLRFLGLPSGYEFSTLIEALVMLGTGESGLSDQLQRELSAIAGPLTLQTFVTPTCPYCPSAVLTAYRLAYHHPQVLAIGTQASEFPGLSERWQIRGVPDTIVSGKRTERVLGGQPERAFLEAALRATSAA
jgi:glutaredoxin-like protein